MLNDVNGAGGLFIYHYIYLHTVEIYQVVSQLKY